MEREPSEIARIESVAERMPCGMFVVSGDRIAFASRRAAELVGYTVDELRSRSTSFRSLFAESSRSKVDLLFGGEPSPREAKLRLRGGRTVDVLVGAAPLLGGTPQKSFLVAVEDLSRRRSAEKGLAESRELHAALLRAFPDAVIVTDLKGRVLDYSACAAEMWLGSETWLAEERGADAAQFVAEAHRPELDLLLRRALDEGSVRGVEMRFLRPDGSTFAGELGMSVMRHDDGRPRGLVATIRDLTDRKAIERENAELQERLRSAIEMERDRLETEVANLKSQISGHFGLDDMIGHDYKMRAVYETILAVASTRATVLVMGETGTGKELVARALHRNSPQRDRPFVKVDCGALAENLLESELFGHVRGAFTGAARERQGRFELADGGAIFLDEIHNLSHALQAKLLRAVQEGAFEKVGGTETITVQTRVIAATNEDLAEMVADGRFRRDLYYRLNVVPVVLPPLRDRKGDIPLLTVHFVKRFAARHRKEVVGITPGAMDRLTTYDWPGNIRELENVIEQAVVLAASTTLDASSIRISEPPPEEAPYPRPMLTPAEEARAIEAAIRRAGGNKKLAARELGISRSGLYLKLRRLGIRTAG